MLDRALAWAAAGWPVFPCYEKPITEWQKKATTNENVIKSWDWDDAKVCVVPGLAGCFVIDVDVKNGKDGEGSLQKLEAEHGFEAWEIPQQATPSGGRHLFFKGTFRTSVQKSLGEGIDTRGGSTGGGLGFIYCYQDDAPRVDSEVPPCPASLLAVSEKTLAVSEETQKPRVELDQPANVERALAYLRQCAVPQEGERNIETFKLVCVLKDLGLSMAKVFEVIEDHPSVTGDPPLCTESEEEFNQTVRSAYKSGQLQPGIHALDEEVRNAAAAGFDTSTGSVHTADENSKKSNGGARRRYTLWSEERDKAPPPWLIRGLLAKVSLAGVYGPGGSYKSFIVLDAALAIASGATEWAGLQITDPGAPIVYVAGEGSATGRAKAWEAVKGEVGGDKFVTYHGLDLSDPTQLQGFQEDLQSLYTLWGRSPGLVIFDTLARAAPGQDENSAKDMGVIVQAADDIKTFCQCCVALIHHTPKGKEEWRGSGAVWNALDTGILVRRGKVPGTASIRLERQKDGVAGKSWAITLEEVATGRKDGDEDEKSLVVKTIEPRVKEEQAQATNNKAAVLARMKDAAVYDLRAKVAKEVLDNTAPGFQLDRDTLLNQMMVKLGVGANRGGARRFLDAAVKRGELQADHPLARYVCDIKGLLFTRASDETAPPSENAEFA